MRMKQNALLRGVDLFKMRNVKMLEIQQKTIKETNYQYPNHVSYLQRIKKKRMRIVFSYAETPQLKIIKPYLKAQT